jgi:hypothetical protein
MSGRAAFRLIGPDPADWVRSGTDLTCFLVSDLTA